MIRTSGNNSKNQTKNTARLLSYAVSSLLSFQFLLLLLSCSGATDKFSLQGRFKNLNQGEFFIYDAERGQRDTIHVRDGRFEYQREMEDSALLMITFPNFSEMPIFARPGLSLDMKGDASHLRETRIEGDKTNEEMTELRLDMAEQTPPEQRKLAETYAADHPESRVSLYLVQRFFIQSDHSDYALAYRLCQTIAQAQPDNQQASRLLQQLEQLKNASASGPLPPFQATDTQGRRVDNTLLHGDAGVVLVWAKWSYESQNLLRLLARKKREYKNRLAVVSISLDASKKEGQPVLDRDSISWPNVCDGQMWQQPILSQLGLATVGGNIVVDKNGQIVGRNMVYSQLEQKLNNLLEK